MVLGESKNEHESTSKFRQFSLGSQKIPEKVRYDHLGTVSTIYDEDSHRVGDRLSKARRVLNAVTGVGIRGKGLNMYTCNIIFWCIVVPTALFGCEIWCLTANDISCIGDFQVYAGKRLQRLHPRSPNICGFVSLGWIHLEILILIRKVIFVRSIMVMGENETTRKVLIDRANKFCSDPEVTSRNSHKSPVFEILIAALRLNMFNEVMNHILGKRVWSKKAWKDFTWKKGWELNDARNDVKLPHHKELDMIHCVSDKISYSVWWSISDAKPEYVYFCETMIKLLCHANDLKCDDLMVKSGPRSGIMCTRCNTNAIENSKHLIMYCEDTIRERDTLRRDIEQIMGEYMPNSVNNIFAMIMGKRITGTPDDVQFRTWITAGQAVHRMYKRRTKNAEGIG